MTPRVRWWAPLFGVAIGACATSPEVARVRGGGPGADIGNKAVAIETHAGNKIYYKTPCKLAKVKCSGPVPDAGM